MIFSLLKKLTQNGFISQRVPCYSRIVATISIQKETDRNWQKRTERDTKKAICHVSCVAFHVSPVANMPMPILAISSSTRSLQYTGKRVFRDGTNTDTQTGNWQTWWLRDWSGPVGRFSENASWQTSFRCRKVSCTVYSLQCQCTVYSVHCTLYTVKSPWEKPLYGWGIQCISPALLHP